MAELSQKSYSPEAAQKLAEWRKNWTEADQERASQQWGAVFADLRRLVAEGADPTGPEGQDLARRQGELVGQFTRGDADVEAGLKQWWKSHDELGAGEQPLAMYSYSKELSNSSQKCDQMYAK